MTPYPHNKPFEKYQRRWFTVEGGWVYEANMSLKEFEKQQAEMRREMYPSLYKDKQ